MQNIVIFRETTAKIASLTDKSNQKGDSGGFYILECLHLV